MKGTMLIYDFDGITPRRVPLEKPTLEAFKQGIGGGRIETVPYLDRMFIEGEWREVVAFCDEDGKHKRLPVNKQATLIWAQILDNKGMTLRDEEGDFLDMLVGPIIVLYGDKEFMEAI